VSSEGNSLYNILTGSNRMHSDGDVCLDKLYDMRLIKQPPRSE